MPRFIAVKCASCDLFQSIQEPKSGKWSCRVCSAKNSVVRVFAISEQAKDIRSIVQQYNLDRGRAMEEVKQQRAVKRGAELLNDDENADETPLTVSDVYASLTPKPTTNVQAIARVSQEKWAGLLEDEDQDEDDGDDLAAHGYSTSLPSKEIEGSKKKRRAQAPRTKNKEATQEQDEEDQVVQQRSAIRNRPAAASTIFAPQNPATFQQRALPAPRLVPTDSTFDAINVSSSSLQPFPLASMSRPTPTKPPAVVEAARRKSGPSVSTAKKPAPSSKWADLLGEEAGNESPDEERDGTLVFTAGDETVL